MKKLLAITLTATMLILTMVSCSKENSKEDASAKQPKSTIKVEENATQPDISVEESEYETLIIENEKYKFSVQKSDFEKNYSEELLMEISALIPLEYGCDDYTNWDGTPEEVINDALSCSFDSRSATFFERYEDSSPERKAAEAETEGYEYTVYDSYTITDIDMINSYIAERFGPDARQFTPEDFDTYEEAVTKDGSVTEGIGTPGYRYIYLPESEVVLCYMSEVTGFGGFFTGLYIYDIQTVEGDYVVKAVACECSDENYFRADTFEEMQAQTLEIFENNTPDVLNDYTMVIGETENGGVYMKSVTKNQLVSEK